MTKYMVENSYIDTSMQKGGIAGFSGCVEHTSVLSQLIHEAKTGKKNLTVVRLDLANVYGSVPHKLIEMAMDHYHILDHFKKIIQKYFGGIQLRFTVDNKTTAWQKDSKDSKISKAGIQTRSGRKWSARTAVDQAESILHHKDIVGNTSTGRQGLGMTHFQQWSKALPK
ncbi:unnamed protein product [Mytilus coruscus]|uniref:Reverse transcriptase domain-containing protein n=1 Tax=Mytilus coruscus TaxID=42192 RepID=A0A6J8D1R9_MYTCO|nr:unnamed protein product [Mytilus coruscus]